MYCIHMITAIQSKMARAAIGWGVRDLAAKANVGISTVTRFENGRGVPTPNNLAAIRSALEAAGVVFVEPNGLGPGVRLRNGA